MSNKKELKETYKQMSFKMGVFQLKNKLNNKIFIGSSTNLEAIWNRYRFQLETGSHRNPDLQKDWKEMGTENFEFTIIDEIEEQKDVELDYNDEVKSLEIMYLETLQPFDNRGYNRRPRM